MKKLSHYKERLYLRMDAVKYIWYAKRFLNDPINYFRKKPEILMEIRQGDYNYEYFNFCYMNNILSLILYSLYHNCIPEICINKGKEQVIQWEWYFKQPFNCKEKNTFKIISCPRKTGSFSPKFQDIYCQKKLQIWQNIYQRFVHFNSTAQEYIDKEYKKLFEPNKKVLGVICRGTDYITLKPAGHPVQPAVDKVIEYCKQCMDKFEYDAIYLATEEKKIRDMFVHAFPDKILENQRMYYDDIYYKENIQYIKDVHFNRENNNYWIGLEYLSSITLLSRCNSLVGGNCGGSMAALFMNNNQYEHVHIFNLGLYPNKK